jgi:hypothetical protein
MGARSQTIESNAEQIVWHWFAECKDGKSMTIEIILDGKPLFNLSFPVCRMRRRDIWQEVQPRQKVLEFFFKNGKRSFFGEPQMRQIEGNIWEAGGEYDAIIFGVSFDTEKRIWLNTLHFGKIEETSQSELVPGLIVRTYPVRNNSGNPNHGLQRIAGGSR